MVFLWPDLADSKTCALPNVVHSLELMQSKRCNAKYYKKYREASKVESMACILLCKE